METLIIKDKIEINASKERVWEVLTNPDYLKQWDELPENYSGGHLELNSVIEWEGYSKLTVTEMEKPDKFKMKMYLPKVDLDPLKYDTCYNYTLTGDSDKTILSFEIGDFSPLPNPQNYFDSSLEWVQAAKQKIKELAEN